MTEEERRRAIQLRLTRTLVEPHLSLAIPSGLAQLDAALGGGFPRGRIVEIFGPPSSGKTALALQAVAHAQQCGWGAAWIDADHTFDAAFAAAQGVQLEKLAVAEPDSAEQAMEMARRLTASSAIDVLVIDSAAALTPFVELAAPMGESGAGLQARALASGFRKLAAEAARMGVAALALNQTRGRAETGDEETTAGGPPLRLHAAVRIALAPAARDRVRFRVLKNKASRPFGEGELRLSAAGGLTESP
jgi:recombination protein RecA